MAAPPAPVLLLLVALLLPAQTCTEPTDSVTTPTPEGNTSESRALPGIKLKARGPSPAPSPLTLLAPLGPLALRLVLG